MKYLVLLLFMIGCGNPKYKFGDCFLPADGHFYAGVVFQLRKYDGYNDTYLACRVDGIISCEYFEEQEIQKLVSCPVK